MRMQSYRMQLSQELTQLEQTRQRAAQEFEQMRDIAITRLENLKSEITQLGSLFSHWENPSTPIGGRSERIYDLACLSVLTKLVTLNKLLCHAGRGEAGFARDWRQRAGISG